MDGLDGMYLDSRKICCEVGGSFTEELQPRYMGRFIFFVGDPFDIFKVRDHNEGVFRKEQRV